MRPLETILPNAKTHAINEAHFLRVTAEQRRIAKQQLSAFVHRVVDTEDRYYDGADRYAIVSFQNLRVLWFTKKADGHWYAAK